MCSTKLIEQLASVLSLSGDRGSVWPTYSYVFRGFVTRNKNLKSTYSAMLRRVDFMFRGEKPRSVVQVGNLEMETASVV